MQQYSTVKSNIYYLKMEQRPVWENALSKEDTNIQQLKKPISTSNYLKLYNSVGGSLNWLDRVLMDDAELAAKINSEDTFIHGFYIKETLAGYCELVRSNKAVEILYFGLSPAFVGKGYGNYFLQKAIDLAWDLTPNYVELNTCDLDHPNALPTYKKMGFKHYKTIIEEKKTITK
ncbi:GNAT family N-acetyltransferase [Saccharicrinis aurantiacus]|uniref:GNAT family N-acetyltransferase n=1 Tax=Saccharicrinis aurantiacus TaxID=1849719 RepID=UPI00094F647E|nr:GNAT family N-acetyltransferase [Saccharicrinis aurantiacus]